MIGQPEQKSLPAFDEIPAFSKLAEIGLTPEKSIQALTDAKSRIKEVMELLGG